MTVYIGPERRKGQRRSTSGSYRKDRDAYHTWRDSGAADRRGSFIERRQEALAGIIVGLTAEDMQRLARIQGDIEAAREEIGGRDQTQDVLDKYTDREADHENA